MHAYVDVNIDNRWISIDGYVLDKELFDKSQKCFKKEMAQDLQIGYFTIFSDKSRVDWDGTDNAFCQFVSEDILVNPKDAPFEKVTCHNLQELANLYNSNQIPTMHKVMQYIDYIPFFSNYIKSEILFKQLNETIQEVRSS